MDLHERNNIPEPASAVAGNEADVRAELGFDLDAAIDAYIQALAEARRIEAEREAREKAAMIERAVEAFRTDGVHPTGFDREIPLPLQVALKVEFEAFNETWGGVTAHCQYHGHRFRINHGDTARSAYWRLAYEDRYITCDRGELYKMVIGHCALMRNRPVEEEIPF